MRGFAILMVFALTVVSCGGADHGPPASTTHPAATANPERIARVRADLPPGYEVAGIAEHSAPVTFWGLRPGWIADPGFCGPLGDPGPGVPSGGWSASGAGGIVYAVIAGPGAALPALPAGLAATLLTNAVTAVRG